MSFYQKLTAFGKRFAPYHVLFKYGFNWSPMYRRTTARVQKVSEDLSHISIQLPLNWKNKNYVGTIFGGSMFAAVDPIPMVQLINLLGDDYVVWDKSAQIRFKRPANESLYADFVFSAEEVEGIKKRVGETKEMELVKKTALMGKDMKTVYCEVDKTIYVADKEYYKEKRRLRKKGIK